MERQLQRVFQQGFQHAVSRRQESWVYRNRSGHFFHMSWRAIWELSLQTHDWISPPLKKKKKEKRPNSLAGPVQILADGGKRRRSSEGEDGAPRCSRTVSGWLAVCRRGCLANSWRRRAGGPELWRSLYTSPSMCGDGRRWRQTTRRAETLLAARSGRVGKNPFIVPENVAEKRTVRNIAIISGELIKYRQNIWPIM